MRCVNPIRVSIAAIALLLVAACASPKHKDGDAAAKPAKPKVTTDDYRRYVRGFATGFSFSRMDDWDSPDPNHVVVWTSPYEAYLLTLFGACFGLDSAHTILLSTRGSMVTPGSDAVMVGNERCPIQNVERLDAKAMKADGVH